MYREMDMSFWLEEAKAERRELAASGLQGVGAD
jgi:hypothetical protein